MLNLNQPNLNHPNSPQLAACLLASADLTLALNKQGLPPAGKWKSTTPAAPCSLTASRTPSSLPTCECTCPTYRRWTLLSAVSPAKMSPSQANGAGWQANAQVCSLMRSTSLIALNPAGLSWKTLRGCSIQTLAKTFKQLSSPLPNAGIWAHGECLMLHISESPQNAVAYSWSLDWESCPPPSLWLTPHQLDCWRKRATQRNKNPMLLCLQASAHQGLTARVATSSLCETDGVRWLSGRERLQIMGFCSDWMRPTLRKLGLRETPSVRRLRAGLPKS